MVEQDVTLNALFEAGIWIETGTPGVYGKSAMFEAIIDGLEALVTEAETGAERVRFPPALAESTFIQSGYYKNFPHLAAHVHAFCGCEKTHASLVQSKDPLDQWRDNLAATDIVLTPAACYPLYPLAARRGPLPADGWLFDVQSYCFRREPSDSPDRLQMFRMREYVRIGSPQQVADFRNAWLERSKDMMSTLGLDYHLDVANDPFFGRAGRLMATSQREQALKFEMLLPVIDAERRTACLSFNYHQDHFGTTFDIRPADGSVAHTGCVGFGLERLTLALLRRHGLAPQTWSADLKRALQL